MRRSWIYKTINGEVVAIPKEECVPEINSAYVQSDIQPYQSMITGEMITSRSQHRDHLRQHRCIEVGNEDVGQPARAPASNVEGIKRTLHEIFSERSSRHFS